MTYSKKNLYTKLYSQSLLVWVLNTCLIYNREGDQQKKHACDFIMFFMSFYVVYGFVYRKKKKDRVIFIAPHLLFTPDNCLGVINHINIYSAFALFVVVFLN